MDQYDMVKGMIDGVLSLDDFVDNEEAISVYSLYEMVKQRLESLYQATHNQELKKKILSISRKKSIKNLFLREKDSCQLYFSMKSNRSDIMLVINHNSSSSLIRDVGSSHFYCNSYQTMIDKEIVEKCALDFHAIFDTLEEYSALFTVSDEEGNILLNNSDYYNFNVDDLFYGDIYYNDLGDVSYSLKIHGVTDDFMKRQWFGDRVNLGKYFHENETALLKKIPIKVSSLQDVFLKIYQEKQKQKVYSK